MEKAYMRLYLNRYPRTMIPAAIICIAIAALAFLMGSMIPILVFVVAVVILMAFYIYEGNKRLKSN